MKTYFLLTLLTLVLLTGCSLSSGFDDLQLGYRVFSLYRDAEGNMPLELVSDIPNDFECIEDYDYASTKNGKGEDIWVFYELVDGDLEKVFRLNSEYDLFLEQVDVTKSDYIDELKVKYLCLSPGLLLNGQLEEEFSNYEESGRLERDLDLYQELGQPNETPKP